RRRPAVVAGAGRQMIDGRRRREWVVSHGGHRARGRPGAAQSGGACIQPTTSFTQPSSVVHFFAFRLQTATPFGRPRFDPTGPYSTATNPAAVAAFPGWHHQRPISSP